MNISGSKYFVEDGDVSLSIVRFLQKYPAAIPIDFLARELGRRPEMLADDINSLQQKGVVTIDPSKQTIVLTEKQSSPLSGLFHWLSGTK